MYLFDGYLFIGVMHYDFKEMVKINEILKLNQSSNRSKSTHTQLAAASFLKAAAPQMTNSKDLTANLSLRFALRNLMDYEGRPITPMVQVKVHGSIIGRSEVIRHYGFNPVFSTVFKIPYDPSRLCLPECRISVLDFERNRIEVAYIDVSLVGLADNVKLDVTARKEVGERALAKEVNEVDKLQCDPITHLC